MSGAGDDLIVEGLVSIKKKGVVGKISEEGVEAEIASKGEDTLFYNPAQVFNRDLSLIAIKVHAERRLRSAFDRFHQADRKKHVGEEVKGLTICEPLGASGLRSLRYIKELPSALCRRVWYGDIDKFAVESAKTNREINGIPEEKMTCLQADAVDLLHSGKYICGVSQWDVVDIDPYGTATPFIDGAVRAVKSGGLLCVTSTDMPVLGGNSPDVAFYKYGGNTVKARYLHEMSLRLVLHSLQMAAAKHRRFVVPLLSVSADFYVRLFVTVWDKAQRCSDIASRTAIVHQCASCDWFTTVPLGRCVEPSERRNKRWKQQDRKEAKRRRRAGASASGAGDKQEENEQSEMPEPAEEQPEKREETEQADTALATEGTPLTTAAPKMVVHSYTGETKPGYKHSVGRLGVETVGSCCPECGSVILIGGPFYAGPLHDRSFLEAMINECEKVEKNGGDAGLLSSSDPEEATHTSDSEVAKLIEHGWTGDRVPHHDMERLTTEESTDRLAWVEQAHTRFRNELSGHKWTGLNKPAVQRIKGILKAMLEEIPDIPLYYKLPSLCNDAHVSMIKLDKFKSALLHMGYRVGLFHREPLSVKTDAPAFVVFDVLRAWIRQEQQQEEGNKNRFARVPERYLKDLDPRTPPVNLNTYHPSLKTEQRGPKWVPTAPNWGPGRRAKHAPRPITPSGSQIITSSSEKL